MEAINKKYKNIIEVKTPNIITQADHPKVLGV